MTKIKAVIADVDGVMVGKQEGVNFPLPHRDVIDALRKLSKSGVPVVLCSAKFRAAIDDIIIQAELNNPHITDGGALIINPLGQPQIIEQNLIDASVVQDYLAHVRAITELYSPTAYFVQKDSYVEAVRRHAQILQTEPTLVDDLSEVAASTPIIKMTGVAGDDHEKTEFEDQLKRLKGKLSFIWTRHPFISNSLCVMTAPGVSKASAARTVATHLGVTFNEILGIGDTPADWEFMQLCGYAATVGDDQELRRLAKSKGAGHYFHASSVDDHGLLAIFEHFNLF